MRHIDLSLAVTAEDLALDEALLDRCDDDPGAEVLRFWEARAPVVVLGRSCDAAADVDLAACEARGIPVLRRASGGGTVLLGPGCLSYSLVLSLESRPRLADLGLANREIMERHRDALAPLIDGALAVEGHTDLALDGRKVSGNAQRRKRRALLFHGTFLLSLDPAIMEALLRLPATRPAYRADRAHGEFVTRLPLAREEIVAALAAAWGARDALADPPLDPPLDAARRLAAARRADPYWQPLPRAGGAPRG